ncbi:uncharacterized protein EAE97_005603 [Botrytis byssoidea]|uniref:Transcription initiation factor TFIID subunit 12 domain-containing protein n=1 Tax=Botrytis byssoidea TaxID=139641 RepID=A0A9P5M3D5_9HELO|nr:uncharacterized protein EAE97_005603 [Botrytis byssoidea]KAF7944970.1 hypothetical protein EAE97_005603 [Botrytis byssoidea]
MNTFFPGHEKPATSQRPQTLFKPEMMRQLPANVFTEEEKAKWEQGLKGLWAHVENNPLESSAHQDAKRKLVEFSKSVSSRIVQFRTQQQQRQIQAQQNQQNQQSQQNQPNQAQTQQVQQNQVNQQQTQQQNQRSPQAQQAPQPTTAPSNEAPQQEPAPQQQEQATQSQDNQATSSNAGTSSQQQARPQINPQMPEKILQHVRTFPWHAPQHLTPQSPEWTKWMADMKNKYAKGLMQMEKTNIQAKGMEDYMRKKREEGTATEQDEADHQTRLAEVKKQHHMAKKFVDEIRENQKRITAGNAHQGQTQHPQQPQAPAPGPSNTNANGNGNADVTASQGTQGAQGTTQMNQTQGAPRPPMNMPQPPNPALQNTQTVNAAIEQARNQQMGGGNRPPGPQGQPSQGPQVPTPNVPTHPTMPQSQPGQAQGIKTEPTMPAPINTAITQMQNNQQRPGQTNSPQSAIPQSANSINAPHPPGPPRALTHQAALQTAAQSYSSAGGQTTTPNTVMGHSHTHPNTMPREQQNPSSTKLPIPKHLPERAIAPPQPVQMGQSRPSFTGGPSGAGNGVMGQPVIAKTPGYVLDGEGDRVLSKKKLDELVRQVTGGGENIAGGGLTAEVEESILTVADNFVDQVLQAACKNAKERGSKILEIRDIQLTLERGYNIRIPGYASDEIRTVRKIAPSSGWINKMSAVQAAKVTGGKGSD